METTKPMGTKKKTNSGFACISLDEKNESPGFFGRIYGRIYHKKNLEKKQGGFINLEDSDVR